MNAMLLAVTALSLLAAAVMAAITWRMRRDERRRSDARVAALSSAIYGDSESEPSAGQLFRAQPAPSAGRLGMVVILGACVVSAIGGAALVVARSPHREPVRASAPRRAPDAPLELLALEHERDGEQLIVRGIVRNPVDAAERDGLSAVILLLGRDGALISTGRAAVPASRLAPGATTPFVISVAGSADVYRFRLSFRTDARIEPHVDRRTS
jgi:hypothetical protein